MKTMLLFVILLLSMGAMQAQEVIQLGEARISYNPDAIVVDSDLNSLSFTVKEKYNGEFSKNPIQFMKQNFDFKGLLSSLEGSDDFYEFLVTFKSKKGYLEATYNIEGELVNTYQKFSNKTLPLDIRRQVYTQNQGWTMVSNKYVASGRFDRIDKEFYKIKLANNNKLKNIKVVPGSTSDAGLASVKLNI
ncbi:hypothetical protein [Gillisia hiemivivida]|uniref:Uncharacterized protein n=1 Tax=Gillisia hiemivivida TaxID=291190 RepID=A0A5C6ZWL3_9FLAO|nr:hypothetical protein [Gillisia hiemivivida]TXD95108.1 hypothetical protein ES724_02860 [Gillisia hiemivivida]